MIKNYIKLAFRNLLKRKFFSAINIAGLAIGISVCILILLFVHAEKSFDEMHKKNIYRLNEVQTFEGMAAPQNVPLSMYPMGPALKQDFPQIKNFVRIQSNEKSGLAFKDKKIFLDKVFWSDPTFFEIFDFKLLKGNPALALEKPNSIVLTEESAALLFGTEDPIGKSITTTNFRYTLHFIVTGVMENVPANSHLQFNGLISLRTIMDPSIPDVERSGWGNNWVITYLELADNADIKSLEAGFPALIKKNMGEDGNKAYKLFLQSVKDIHGASSDITHDYHNYQKFDKTYTNIFSLIAGIVLIIACINFINLSTAQSAGRAKEVGVKKSIGAHKLQLALQFIGESFFLTFIAMFLALVLVRIFLPWVNALCEHTLEFSFVKNPRLFLFVFAGTCCVGIVSGLYPALYLSSFNAVKALKGGPTTLKNKSALRNILVVGQFTAACFLIIAVMFVVRQLNYMRNKDAGFNKEQVMIISGVTKNYSELKSTLLGSTLVKGVSGSAQRLGNNMHQAGFSFRDNGPVRYFASSHILTDEDFISLYEIKLSAGKKFTRGGNGKEYMVNESMAKELLKDKPKASLETLLGKNLWWDGDTAGTIVAVVKDFNFNSLHNKIETLCIVNQQNYGFNDISVKIDGTRTKEAIAFIESAYKKIAPQNSFQYEFLDEHFNQLYKADEKVSKVVGILGMFAVIIACLGLLGLASYSASRRIKEIGVRKVLGASVSNIVALLTKDFLKLVLIANLLAWPLALVSVSYWMQGYAYHIEITWWIFLLAGIISVFIALFAIASQTIKAAIANPVKSLRTE